MPTLIALSPTGNPNDPYCDAASHRFSWKSEPENVSEQATVYTWSSDHWIFGARNVDGAEYTELHGKSGEQARKVLEAIRDEEYIQDECPGMIEVLFAWQEQHPDGTWFVG